MSETITGILGYLIIPALLSVFLFFLPLCIGLRSLLRGPRWVGILLVLISLSNLLPFLGQQTWIPPRLLIAAGALAEVLLASLLVARFRNRLSGFEVRGLLPSVMIGGAFAGLFFLMAYFNFGIASLSPEITSLVVAMIGGVAAGFLARTLACEDANISPRV